VKERAFRCTCLAPTTNARSVTTAVQLFPVVSVLSAFRQYRR
jgi:hypothetical protein